MPVSCPKSPQSSPARQSARQCATVNSGSRRIRPDNTFGESLPEVPANQLLLRSTRECPRQESNLRTRFRKPLLYPLSYGGRRQKSKQNQASSRHMWASPHGGAAGVAPRARPLGPRHLLELAAALVAPSSRHSAAAGCRWWGSDPCCTLRNLRPRVPPLGGAGIRSVPTKNLVSAARTGARSRCTEQSIQPSSAFAPPR